MNGDVFKFIEYIAPGQAKHSLFELLCFLYTLLLAICGRRGFVLHIICLKCYVLYTLFGEPLDI